MSDNKTIEKAILHAIALKEKGVAVPTILAVFPEERKHISAAFDFIGNLRLKRDDLSPSQESFSKTLVALSNMPAVDTSHRHLTENIKGSVSQLKHKIASVPSESFTSSFKIPRLSPYLGWVAGAVALVVIAAVAIPKISTDSTLSTDSFAASFEEELQTEAELIEEGNSDVEIAQSDVLTVNEFDTTYDQTN